MITPDKKCLYCYKVLENNETDYHEKCSKIFFGTAVPPQIEFGLSDLKDLAIKVLGKSESVTGVQPKISMETLKSNKNEPRLTVVGLWGIYILKPPRIRFPEMPENEDLTMHLSSILRIKTAEHSLIRLKSGELAYITKRFDRNKKGRLPLEDMAQLTGTLTENKYRGSMERIGKIIKKYSTYPGVDLISLYELTLLSFITGNSDMHLKNFSLLTNADNEVMISPAYDLLSTKLLLKEDNEELALTINGKKNNLKKADFLLFAENLGINEVSIKNVHIKFKNSEQQLLDCIDSSFLSSAMKAEYKKLLSDRLGRF
jgi:serine/threonine-protein kinase HipA